jgi:addiction module RelE/StbE family toxin
MVEIEWTPQALEDVDEIAKYIARDSPKYAEITAQKIFHSLERIRKFPRSGRIIPEFNDVYLREVIMDNYRVMYLLTETSAFVFTVMHGRRDVVKKLTEVK